MAEEACMDKVLQVRLGSLGGIGDDEKIGMTRDVEGGIKSPSPYSTEFVFQLSADTVLRRWI